MYKNEAWNDAIGLHKAPKTYEAKGKSRRKSNKSSSSTSSSALPLKGDKVFVDVPKGGDELKQTLTDLGAKIVKSRKAASISHIVFDGGSPSTLALLDDRCGAFGVTPAWVEECKATGSRVNELDFNFSSASKSSGGGSAAKKKSAKRKKASDAADKENEPDELNSQKAAAQNDDEVSDFEDSDDEVVPAKGKKRAKLSPQPTKSSSKPTSSKATSSSKAKKSEKKPKEKPTSSAKAKKSPTTLKPSSKAKKDEKEKPAKKTPKDKKEKSATKPKKKASPAQAATEGEKASATKKKRGTGPPNPATIKRRKSAGDKVSKPPKESKSDAKQKKPKKSVKKKKKNDDDMSDEESDNFIADDLDDDISDEEEVSEGSGSGSGKKRSQSARSSTGSSSSSSAKKKRKSKQTQLRGLACSKLETGTSDIMYTALKKFKRFRAVHDHSDNFSHLVVERKARTLKVLFGIARGAWVLTQEWLCASVEAGKWLPEADFELEDYPGCRKSRLAHAEKDHKGLLKGLKVHMATVDDPENPINYSPPLDVLKALITAAGGKVWNDYWSSEVCIAHPQLYPEDTRVPIVNQEWLLASITDYEVKPYDDFIHETADHSQESNAPVAADRDDERSDESMANSDDEGERSDREDDEEDEGEESDRF